MILKESKFIGDINYDDVLELLDEGIVNDDKYRLELIELIKKADTI